ncbi:MAG: hypothetical protein H7Y11_14415, partial [Armatimonadetes bacterium]|nr:hypothetical protein [Anaerolineae bacterium]
MVTKRYHISMMLYLLLGCLTFGVHAQASAEAPLVINISGQLYRWLPGESEPTAVGCDLQGNQLRNGDYSLSASLDGQWAAFNVVPVGSQLSAPATVGDLWVCNLHTAEAYVISVIAAEGTNLASEGVFSPDGSRIAWSEVVENQAASRHARILVHDFASRMTSVLVETTPFDQRCGIGQDAPRLVWGKAGIAARYHLPPKNDPCGETIEMGLVVYSEDGRHKSSYPVSKTIINIDTFEWVEEEDEPQLVYRVFDRANRTSQIFSINIAQDRVEETVGVLKAYSSIKGPQYGSYLISDDNLLVPPLIYLPDTETPLQSFSDVAFSPD